MLSAKFCFTDKNYPEGTILGINKFFLYFKNAVRPKLNRFFAPFFPQVLNPIDQFGPKLQTQQQFNVRTNTNYVSSSPPQPDLEKYKSPKQQFSVEQPRTLTYQQQLSFLSSTPKSTSTSKNAVLEDKPTRNSTSISEQFNSAKTKKKEPINTNNVASSSNENKDKTKSQLAALPAEVPDDLREQLLASGILSNADIQILDYDKVGDIPIENLPPEALENLYGSGSAPVPSIAFANASKSTPAVEMKVVRYDPSTADGQTAASSYVQEDATEVDPVVLNDSSYNRYLPLKIKGSHFPIPDSPLLKNKRITSVVVLAPVDYDYVQQEAERQGKSVPQVHGVRFASGDSLKTLVKNPTQDNFVKWIEKEKETPSNQQSVILLVTK